METPKKHVTAWARLETEGVRPSADGTQPAGVFFFWKRNAMASARVSAAPPGEFQISASGSAGWVRFDSRTPSGAAACGDIVWGCWYPRNVL